MTNTKSVLLDVFDVVAFLVFIIGIVLFIRFFIFNPFSVVGLSMYPTFQESDFIIVDKITPRRWQLKRGDIIVFVPPSKDVPYIKRIIWLPWEIIHIKDGKVFVCSWDTNLTTWTNLSWNTLQWCNELLEPYLPPEYRTEARCWKDTFFVTGGYFVLWDNRWHTTDSLCCFGYGCYKNANYIVPPTSILWKVFVRLFPSPRINFDTYQQ